ncbi:MAG TPA: STAS domain-containing protein [Anaerolineales bacterium]|nr:STAS domain-containing protein [Anaerolineales bacterium]
MNSELSITVKSMQGQVPVTVFHLKGDIDGKNYEQLQTRAKESFDSGTRHLLLDLSEVPFLSSAGIRALQYIFTMLRTDPAFESDEAIRKGIRDGTFKSPHLKLLNPNANISQVLRMTGYDMFLEVYSNLEAAVNSF